MLQGMTLLLPDVLRPAHPPFLPSFTLGNRSVRRLTEHARYAFYCPGSTAVRKADFSQISWKCNSKTTANQYGEHSSHRAKKLIVNNRTERQLHSPCYLERARALLPLTDPRLSPAFAKLKY